MANRDIYNRLVELGKPISSDATRMIVNGVVEEDMLAQNFQAQYSQKINRLYEVGSVKTFLFIGRTAGQMQSDRLIGGKGISEQFIKDYGDACKINQNAIALTMDVGCDAVGDLLSESKVRLVGVLVEQVAYKVQAEQNIVNENLQALFIRMEF